MPIVKQPSTKPLIRDAVVLDLGDLGRQAAKLREAAAAKAKQILIDAKAEADRIVAAAEKTGYDAGYAEGLAKGTEAGQAAGHAEALAAGGEQVKQVTERFLAVAGEWDAARAELERDARTRTLDFALKFAQKLTHRVIEADAGVVADQVAAALSRVMEPTDVVIHVHPDDRATLSEVLPDLLAGLSHLQRVDLTDDPAVGRGGCRLSLRGGEVDAAIDTQIARLVDAIQPPPVVADDPRESPDAPAT